MGELLANPSMQGNRIDLSLSWTDPVAQSRSLRLVRRRYGYPTGPSDGLVLLDLADAFQSGDVPWFRIDRQRFLIINTPAESGLLQAEIALYFGETGDQPLRAVITIYDFATNLSQVYEIPNVVQVATTQGSNASFAAVTTIVISAPAGGTAVISEQASNGITPDRFEWTALGGTTIAASFVRQEIQSTTATVRMSGPWDLSFVTSIVLGGPAGDVTIRSVDFTESQNPDTGVLERSMAIVDLEPSTRNATGFEAGLEPEVTYYYAAFEDVGGGFAAGPLRTASALATRGYGFAETLYALLPGVHRYYDDPAGGQQGTWALRRFLEVVGPSLDQARSYSESLRTLHDSYSVRADFLPHLAQWLGWPLNLTLPTSRQRTDIEVAPEVFTTVGTLPNVEALAKGTSEAYKKLGFDASSHELGRAVLLALSDPSAESRWYNGESVFVSKRAES